MRTTFARALHGIRDLAVHGHSTHGTQSGRIVLTGGYWDNHIRHTLDSSMGEIHGEWAPSRKASHLQAVTCLQLADDGMTLASGSLDCTVRVWKLGLKNEVAPDDYMQLFETGQRSNISSSGRPDTSGDATSLRDSGRDVRGADAASGTGVTEQLDAGADIEKGDDNDHDDDHAPGEVRPLFTLCSHTDPVSCLAISANLDILVTCGMDSYIAIHELSIGRMLRKIQYPSSNHFAEKIVLTPTRFYRVFWR